MYNLCKSNDTEERIFDLTNYRGSQIQRVLDSTSDETRDIRIYLDMLIDKSESETENSIKFKMKKWFVKQWKFDPTVSVSDLTRIVNEKKVFASSPKEKQTKSIITEGSYGPDIKIDQLYEAQNQTDEKDRLQKNYRYLLTGVMKMADSLGKKNYAGMKIRTMYTNWLYMINNSKIDFIDPLTGTSTYRSQKEPNKIINCYTNPTVDGVPVEERMRTAVEAYIHSSLRKKDVGQTFELFMLDVYYLFNQCLKQGMLDQHAKYDNNKLDNELKVMENRFPDTKFTEEYIRKTNSIEEWFKYQPEDLNNEFGIAPFEFLLSPLEVPQLEPLDTGRYVKLEAEKESLNLAYHLSTKLTGEDAKLYDAVFNARMNILEKRENSYAFAKEIKEGLIQLRPTTLYRLGQEDMGLGMQLVSDLMGFRSKSENPVSEEVKTYIREIINEQINRLAQSYLDYYKRRDWSMKVLTEDSPITSITKGIRDTLIIKDGVHNLLDKPMCLALNINNTTGRSLSNLCAITEDYILVYPDHFVIPSIKIVEKKKVLSTDKIHDRGIIGANYR